MGHAVGDITGLYQTRELLAWLDEDAKRLAEFAGETVPGNPYIHPYTSQDRGSVKPVSPLFCNSFAPLAQLAEQVTLNH